MPVSRDTHRNFLTDNGASEEMVDRTMRLMKPLFTIGENGTYPLMSKEELEAEGYGLRFTEAIAKVADLEVEKVIFVSIENPFPKQEWMSKDDYRKNIEGIVDGLIRNSFGSDLWRYLEISIESSLRNSLYDSLYKNFADSLQNSLWRNFGISPRASPENSSRHSLVSSLGGSCRTSLFYLNGFALVGDKENFDRVAPIVELQAKALPISNLKHAPRTWLVLCK